MLKRSLRKLFALILAVILGLYLLHWLRMASGSKQAQDSFSEPLFAETGFVRLNCIYACWIG